MSPSDLKLLQFYDQLSDTAYKVFYPNTAELLGEHQDDNLALEQDFIYS